MFITSNYILNGTVSLECTSQIKQPAFLNTSEKTLSAKAHLSLQLLLTAVPVGATLSICSLGLDVSSAMLTINNREGLSRRLEVKSSPRLH